MDVPNRSALERTIARRVGRELRGEVYDIVDMLNETPSYDDIPSSFWRERGTLMQNILKPLLVDVFITQAQADADYLNVSVDWNLVNERAANWASDYSFELVKELTDTSQQLLKDSISSYFTDGLSIGELEDKLTGAFGPVRAEMISVTEVTRAASAGEEGLAAELEAMGIHMNEVWNTNNDELVCEICGPLDQTAKGEAWTEAPPAHVNCRCWVGLEIANG